MITIYTSDLCVQVARLVTDVMTSSERCPEGPSSERLSRASVSPATATQAWNLPAKVEVETVDHNHHQWPLSPGSMIDWSHMWWQVAKVVQGPSSERFSQASVSPATATQAWKLACYSWCRDSWSQSAQLANESKSQKMITNISLKQISLAFEAKSDLAEIAKMHVSPATVSASFKLAF